MFKPGICHFHQFFSYIVTSRFACTGGEPRFREQIMVIETCKIIILNH